jgi:outer membrane receptor protein involved in Fe transport
VDERVGGDPGERVFVTAGGFFAEFAVGAGGDELWDCEQFLEDVFEAHYAVWRGYSPGAERSAAGAQTFNPRGRFEYNPAQTGTVADTRRNFANSFAAFLLDQPSQAGRDLPFVFPARRELISNIYFQDKWQVSSKLTVDLGLRFERERGSRPRLPGGFPTTIRRTTRWSWRGWGRFRSTLRTRTTTGVRGWELRTA